jgi:hypothetical protein
VVEERLLARHTVEVRSREAHPEADERRSERAGNGERDGDRPLQAGPPAAGEGDDDAETGAADGDLDR